MRLPVPDGPTCIVSRPITSSSGCTAASDSRSPPTMKKTSPLSACGDEPSIGVSRWDTPRPRAAAWMRWDTSGPTVEQSQVMSPGRAPARMPAAPRYVSVTISLFGSAVRTMVARAATSRGAACAVMPVTPAARLRASAATSKTWTRWPLAARLRAMGNPIRPSPMNPISRVVMVASAVERTKKRGRPRNGPPLPTAKVVLGDLALLVLLLRGALHAAFLDLAAPRARLAAAALDELLEPLHIPLDARLHDAKRVTEVLQHAVGIVVELEHRLGTLVVQPMEGDDAGVPGSGPAGPGDPLIRGLLGDLRIPLLELAGDLGLPVQPLVVELAHFLDAFHEAGELLELRPLVVRNANGHVHLDGLFDAGHGCPPSWN